MAGPDDTTTVVHAQGADNQHIVGITTLHVLISQDDTGSFAQGLEIDYASAGQTPEEARDNFETGLSLTVEEHLKLHGHLEHFLKLAPQEVWNDYYEESKTKLQTYSVIELFDLAPSLTSMEDIGFPYKCIEFVGAPQSEAV